MLASNNPYHSYRQTQIETASPLELVIKLYDGAIRFINQAKRGIEDKDYTMANESIKRALDIIEELNYTLNMEAGEIAGNLRSIYNFMNQHLTEANVKKDTKKIDEVVQLLMTLRSAWLEIQHNQKKVASNA